MVVREPGLSNTIEPSKAVAESAPTRAVTFIDRHPLFWKPRDYYEGSGSNPVVKTATATVIGIPAGIVGELRQIVSGVPAEQPR